MRFPRIVEPRFPMNLKVPPEFESAILERVASGAYESTDDVLRACLEALTLLEAGLDDQNGSLRRAVQIGIDSANHEPIIPREEAIERMRARAREVRP
jgi:putative addiction module CopG family antidote